MFSSFVCRFSRTLFFLSVPGKQEQAELHAVLRTEIMGKSTCLDSLQWLSSVIFYLKDYPFCSNWWNFILLNGWVICEESWTLKNWWFWTLLLEKTLAMPLDCKEIQPVHPSGDQYWLFIGRTDAEVETPILWPPHVKSWLIGKRPWCWEGLGAGGEGDNRGWDGWTASPTRCTWVWVISRSWWWTGSPGVLRFMGLQRVGHNWATELNWGMCTIGQDL